MDIPGETSDLGFLQTSLSILGVYSLKASSLEV